LAYLLAYEEWENSLSSRERALLGRASAPDLEDYRAHTSKREVIGALGDAAERSAASYSPNMEKEIDRDADHLAEIAGLSKQQALIAGIYLRQRIEEEAARREAMVITTIAGSFMRTKNPKLLAAGLAFASDLAITAGMGTMQDWAVENSVSRAAVSKTAKFWQRNLKLPAGSHMRPEEKCRAYSEAQKTKHWRNQKVRAAALGAAEEQERSNQMSEKMNNSTRGAE